MHITTIEDFTFHLNKIFDESDSFVEYQQKNGQIDENFLLENFCKVIQISDLHIKNINLH